MDRVGRLSTLALLAAGLTGAGAGCRAASSHDGAAYDAAYEPWLMPDVTCADDAGAPADAGDDTGDTGRDRDAAAGDAGADDVAEPVPTFTEIYEGYLVNYCYRSACWGPLCHNPGTQKGVTMTTRALAYRTLSDKLVPGDPDGSLMVQLLTEGSMPSTRPHMPAADLARIRAWIAAGARDD